MWSLNMCITLILLWAFIVKINGIIIKTKRPKSGMSKRTVNIQSKLINATRLDCNENKNVLCNFAIDCFTTCRTDGHEYECDYGRCVRKIVKKDDPNEEIFCNQNHGIYKAIESINELNVAKWSCVSMYPELWSDEDKKNPGACQGGTLNTNVYGIKGHAPELTDCKCPDGSTLSYFSGKQISAANAQIPVCLPSDRLHLYTDYTQVQKPEEKPKETPRDTIEPMD